MGSQAMVGVDHFSYYEKEHICDGKCLISRKNPESLLPKKPFFFSSDVPILSLSFPLSYTPIHMHTRKQN